MTKVAKVSVVIPSFNEGDWLLRTVRSCLEKTVYPDFDIVVVADGCTDNSVQPLKKAGLPNLTLLENKTSQGAIVTRNQGARAASGDVLVFIDSHQEPLSENWLTVLASLLEKNNCGAATINIADVAQPDRLGYLYTVRDWSLEPTWKRPPKIETDCLTGAIPGGCFAIKKSLFLQTGGFNSSLKKWGREDFEYSLRLWRLGYDLWFSSQAVMGHAFNHKRQFKITWEQVDFNTLWVAETLFDEAAKSNVHAFIKQQRPASYALADKALKQACEHLDKKQKSTFFKRSFKKYARQFMYLDS